MLSATLTHSGPSVVDVICNAAGMNQKVSDRGTNWYLFGQGDRLVFDAIILRTVAFKAARIAS